MAKIFPAREKAATFAHEPSSQEQLHAKFTFAPGYEPADDASLPTLRRAWEILLRENLGDFYYPRYLEAKRAGHETAWDYVEDVQGLPRVLLIGDSISRGYTIPVRQSLAGKSNVYRAPENCGSSRNGIRKLPIWLGDRSWALIVFNFGIHDRGTPVEEYRTNLRILIGELRRTGARLLWATSTPVPDGAAEFVPGAMARLNATASELMREEGIPVIDLYAHIQPCLAEFQLPDNCHYSEAGYELLGGIVSASIIAALFDRGMCRG